MSRSKAALIQVMENTTCEQTRCFRVEPECGYSSGVGFKVNFVRDGKAQFLVVQLAEQRIHCQSMAQQGEDRGPTILDYFKARCQFINVQHGSMGDHSEAAAV